MSSTRAVMARTSFVFSRMRERVTTGPRPGRRPFDYQLRQRRVVFGLGTCPYGIDS
jgi:hypothetical protein